MTDAKQIMDRVKSLKSKSDSMAMKKTKGTITGGFIGMGVGLLYGIARNHNLVSSAFTLNKDNKLIKIFITLLKFLLFKYFFVLYYNELL